MGESATTKPEIPVGRLASFAQERSAVHRREPLPKTRNPLADLVEEVVTRPDDPRTDP